MADHLAYIRVAGLESDPEECFQGLGISSSVPGVTPAPGGTTNLEWGEIPAEALTMLQQYTEDLNAWIETTKDYDPDSGARAVPAVIQESMPAIPILLGTLATGGTALPAVATVLLSQAILNWVGSAVADYAENFDENSPRNLFKKAFLYTEEGNANELLSILKKAYLYQIEIDGQNETHSVLKDKLEDLTLMDAELKYADNTSLHIKGKVLNH